MYQQDEKIRVTALPTPQPTETRAQLVAA